MNIPLSDLIEGLDWYWSRKNEARECIYKLKKSDLHLARRYYGEYFLYLVSAIEMVNDFHDGFPDQVKGVLAQYGNSGENNYEYLRLLRHCVIHRGEDLVATGAPTDERLNPVSPRELRNHSGRRVFSRFTPYLDGVIRICEFEFGKLIDSFLLNVGAWDVHVLANEAERRAVELIGGIEHMPCAQKPIALEQVLPMLRSTKPWEITIPSLREKLTEPASVKSELESFILLSEADWKGRVCQCVQCTTSN